MTWPQTTIGDLVDAGFAHIQTGPFGTQLKASEYVADGIPVINVRNIGYRDLRPSELEFVTEEKARQLSAHKLQPDDIVFGRKGAVDRHLFVAPEHAGWIQGSDCIRLRLNSDRVLPSFASYAMLRSAHLQWMLTQSGNKATMASLNHDVIRRINLPVPTRDMQVQISAILATYDDLIENNRRRIKLLEEAARLIYREWFVHLRFPGHEHTKIVDGLPGGWIRVKTSGLCESLGGGTPATGNPAFWEGGEIPWVVPSDVTKNGYLFLPGTERQITDAGLRGSSAQMLPAETILMTSRASVGFFAVVDKPVSTNQGFINLVPRKPELRMYLLCCLMSRVDEIRALAGGSTYPEISKGKFREISVIEPSHDILMRFESTISPLIEQTRVLIQQNCRLMQARDLLLPRLMSGEIEV